MDYLYSLLSFFIDSSSCLIDSLKTTHLIVGGKSLFQNIWLADRRNPME